MKPKDPMKTALLICALTSMSPAFANGTMVKADNLTPPYHQHPTAEESSNRTCC